MIWVITPVAACRSIGAGRRYRTHASEAMNTRRFLRSVMKPKGRIPCESYVERTCDKAFYTSLVMKEKDRSKHIRRKYQHFESQIKTPEDFIRICASKSLVSGEAYLVVTPQGTVTVESWLSRILIEFRERS